MKGIVLRDYEIRRLQSAGSVLIWRRLKPQPCLDFPTGFRIQKQYPLTHHPECSFKHGMLCDCGAIDVAWKAELESRCTHCRDGETRFVKEPWASIGYGRRYGVEVVYGADNTDFPGERGRQIDADVPTFGQLFRPMELTKWPSHRMPEWASRFRVFLAVSCRQIQSVTEEEAVRSGSQDPVGNWKPVLQARFTERDAFKQIMDRVERGSWDRNEWYWCIEAKEVK